MRTVMSSAGVDTMGAVSVGKAPSLPASSLDSTAMAAMAATRHMPANLVPQLLPLQLHATLHRQASV